MVEQAVGLETTALIIVTDMVEDQKIPKEKALDPATIVVIIQVITAIVNGCMKNRSVKDGVDCCNNPGLFQRVALKHIVKKQMGREAFREHGQEVISAFLKHGSRIDEQAYKQILFDVEMAE